MKRKRVSKDDLRLKKRGHPLPWKAPRSFITCDPGTINFFVAWTKDGNVQRFHHVESAIRALPSGMLYPRLVPFVKELKVLLDKTKATHVLVEKFSARNFGSSNTEFISTMIGAMALVCRRRGVTMELVTASEWKTPLKRIMDYDALVKDVKKSKIPQHVVDCVCTSRYLLSKYQFRPSDPAWIKTQLKRLSNGTERIRGPSKVRKRT